MARATVPLLRTLVSLVSLTTVTSTIVFSPAVRVALLALFNPKSHPIRFTALLLALFLNGKSLPFVWHARFAKAMGYQLYAQPSRLPKDALFRPIVTKAVYTPLPECDYNGHKSNSTYFSDLDMARTQLVAALLRKGIRNASKQHDSKGLRIEDGKGNPLDKPLPPGRFGIALGAVSCHFKREIKPYERFEIWTRVLAWDRKWVYVLSHMVEEDAISAASWSLQPWRKGRKAQAPASSPEERQAQKEAWRKKIFATSISKYVVKKGRLTIPPEVVLRNSDLLPPKPDEASMAGSVPEMVEGEGESWTWERVEAERVRGMTIASHYDALDQPGGVHDEFPQSQMWDEEDLAGVQVLGEWHDLYFG